METASPTRLGSARRGDKFLRLAQTAFAVQRSEASAELEREDALELARELRRGG